GKSRLCSKFIDRTRAAGTVVYQAHCLSHGKSLSFLPMLELLRTLLGISEGDAERDQRRKIAGELILLDKSFADVLPLVFDFLGVADPEQPAPKIAADARQRQLFHFVRRLVRAKSALEPAVLFLDDAHWIDAGTDRFLAQIVEAVTDTRALLLVNFRPEYHADWMGKSEYQQLPLRPLAAKEIEALFDELIGDDTSGSGLRELIRERTGGNPFFVEEVVYSLAESGALEGSRGTYRLVEPIETLEVPTTVQPVLAARIDRLGEREKQALQAASVIGREFSEPVLSAVLGWPAEDLFKALQTLKSGEFLYEQSLFPVTEYAFKHPLTQEVALGSQLRERRARTHAEVARALEAAYPDRLDEQAALLAHHYGEAGETLLAGRWHARAADWVIKTNFTESNVHWRRAYELAKTEPSTPEFVELLFGACVRLVMGSFASFFPDEDRDRFAAEGRDIAERTGNRVGLFLLEMSLAVSRNLAGGATESPLVPARRAVQIAEDLSTETRIMARFALGNVLWVHGAVSEALRETEEALALAGPKDMEFGDTFTGFSIKNFASFQRASLLMLAGRPREAMVDFEQSLKTALQRSEYGAVCQICAWSGPWFEELTGTPQQALARGQQGVDWAERGGDDFNLTLTKLFLGMAQLMAGRVAEALESLRYVDHMQRELGIASHPMNLAQGLLAEAHLAAGDAANARAAAERCAIDRDAWVFDLRGLLSRARVLRALDGSNAREEIEATLARAQQLLEKSEARAFAPFIIEERARLAEVLRDGEAAAQALREAQSAFAEVDATGHVERLAKQIGGFLQEPPE
ncbi:MAG: AAA family ATPase, partial [Deltaproteobacteria bacterium]|nr:AAA family ATPase [Deltaproteobacteria bacterium]